ncbi:hypothetical protein evm_012471 [Chilo suppressalis]|nr:hypothetical protein evm_012471 [Chilo suppressalis]
MEKLIQKLKPSTPEQWDSLLRKFENAISTRLKETQKVASKNDLNATAIEETQSETKEVTKENTEKKEEKAVEGFSESSPISFDSLMRGLKLKKDLHFGKISEPSWKNNKPIVTKTSIHSRTAYVISALLSAESADALRRRAEHFVDHLLQYPEARDYAIKEGAVRALLRVRHRLEDDTPVAQEVRGIVNEALALVGYSEYSGRGPRILSLDGGGVRGLASLYTLRRLQLVAGLPVHRLFDYIVGVSTGAIIAALLGSGGTLEMASEMYMTLSKQMFGNTSVISGASRLVWSQSYYDTSAWEKLLQQYLGDRTLSQCNRIHAPKLALVSCVSVGGARARPFLFRSYECGYRVRSVYPGDYCAPLWRAVRASAAAPTYFQEMPMAGLLHQDGGIVVNNPTGVGLHEARLIFGADAMTRATVVSVGTGKVLPQHQHQHQHQHQYSKPASEPQYTSWKDKFNKILDSATDTEGVHQVLQDLLPAGAYYRFNPPLLQPCAMDETDPQKLRDLQTDAADYCRRNTHKLQQAAARLTQPPTLTQRVSNFIRHRAILLGATDPR